MLKTPKWSKPRQTTNYQENIFVPFPDKKDRKNNRAYQTIFWILPSKNMDVFSWEGQVEGRWKQALNIEVPTTRMGKCQKVEWVSFDD